MTKASRLPSSNKVEQALRVTAKSRFADEVHRQRAVERRRGLHGHDLWLSHPLHRATHLFAL